MIESRISLRVGNGMRFLARAEPMLPPAPVTQDYFVAEILVRSEVDSLGHSVLTGDCR